MRGRSAAVRPGAARLGALCSAPAPSRSAVTDGGSPGLPRCAGTRARQGRGDTTWSWMFVRSPQIARLGRKPSSRAAWARMCCVHRRGCAALSEVGQRSLGLQSRVKNPRCVFHPAESRSGYCPSKLKSLGFSLPVCTVETHRPLF